MAAWILCVTTQDLQKFKDAQEAAFVLFDNGGGHTGETWNNVTDKNGDATTYISGRPQAQDLSHFKLLTVQKKGAVSDRSEAKGGRH
jgi:hypothetical protein